MKPQKSKSSNHFSQQNQQDKAQVCVGRPMPLSLAYNIITKGHGGTIEVESVEGEGATFIVKLPIV